MDTTLEILVAFMGVTVAVFGYVFRWLIGQRAEIEAIVEAQVKELWTKMSQVDQEMSADRRHASEFRERIAREMITKDDLNREMSRVINEVDRRFTNTLTQRLPARGD